MDSDRENKPTATMFDAAVNLLVSSWCCYYLFFEDYVQFREQMMSLFGIRGAIILEGMILVVLLAFSCVSLFILLFKIFVFLKGKVKL